MKKFDITGNENREEALYQLLQNADYSHPSTRERAMELMDGMSDEEVIAALKRHNENVTFATKDTKDMDPKKAVLAVISISASEDYAFKYIMDDTSILMNFLTEATGRKVKSVTVLRSGVRKGNPEEKGARFDLRVEFEDEKEKKEESEPQERKKDGPKSEAQIEMSNTNTLTVGMYRSVGYMAHMVTEYQPKGSKAEELEKIKDFYSIVIGPFKNEHEEDAWATYSVRNDDYPEEKASHIPLHYGFLAKNAADLIEQRDPDPNHWTPMERYAYYFKYSNTPEKRDMIKLIEEGEVFMAVKEKLNEFTRSSNEIMDAIGDYWDHYEYEKDQAEKEQFRVERDDALKLVEEQKTVIAEKDSVITDQKAVIAEKDTVITDQNAALAEKDTALAESNLNTQIILMRYQDNMADEEIAEALSITVERVEKAFQKR